MEREYVGNPLESEIAGRNRSAQMNHDVDELAKPKRSLAEYTARQERMCRLLKGAGELSVCMLIGLAVGVVAYFQI